ncbi:MAG: redoxin domain-containing protein [Acidobacteria bacterium]|nr:redoxin domain-containing protein [Acidobacteriota bacterium]MBS1864694.1 redoxin domain-containing protein [Acidobacteriota bacterium]
MFCKNAHVTRIRFTVALLACSLLSLAASAAAAQTAFTLDGKPINPFPGPSGKPIVLIFVRTDCPISNRYAPVLRGLFDSKYHRLATFWLVYPDKKTAPQQIRAHVREFQFGIDALRDPDHVLVKRAGATITPEAAVFDSSGNLLYRGRIDNLYVDAGRARPAATTHELKDAIESAIYGKTPMPVSASAVGCYISDLE